MFEKLTKEELSVVEKGVPVLLGLVKELEKDRDRLIYALAGMLWCTSMKNDRYNRGWWLCPMCRAEHNNLTEFEDGIGHNQDCVYAEARNLLDELKKKDV